jgi:Protein of unknown function (DUF1549)/Protein of unknown function (DUF1553)
MKSTMNPLLRPALAAIFALAGIASAAEPAAPSAKSEAAAPAKSKADKTAPKKLVKSVMVAPLQTPPSISPKSDKAPELKATAAKIDQLVLAKLTSEKLTPNALTSDEAFVRRVYLDVVGRIPTKAEALEFLESKDAGKRAKLVDKLLDSDGYVQNYFNFWADVLRIKNGLLPGGQGREAGSAYIQWLKDSLRANKPYDLMVREMLTADGGTYEDGAVGFYMRDYNMPLDNMAVTTQIFLGTQMVCAQCHNHPFDKWTQQDYYQIAAHSYGMTGTNALANQGDVERFLTASGVRGEERKDVSKAFSEILFRLRFNHISALDKALRLPHDYKYPDAKPEQKIEPVIPASFSKDGKIAKDGEHPILAYSQWMTAKANPRFTLVIANRLWKKVMGLGVIDPVDELTDSTVPSNPQLMEFLEQTMKDADYDMKAYLRILLNTKAYQREAFTKDVEAGVPFYFPGPVLRRMTAEQIWDSIIALAKDNPDEPSQHTIGETMLGLTRIEWMDRTIRALTPAELADGAKQVAAYQRELTADIQKKTAELKNTKDEEAIRAAKAAAKGQRNRIYEKADEIVFNEGFQKFAKRVSENPDAVAKETDPEFAGQVASAVKHYGRIPTMEEALSFVLKEEKAQIAQFYQERRDREAKEWGISKKALENFKTFCNFRDYNFIRAADLRNPAPNGHFLRLYGQSDREIVDNSNRDASVMQALTMMNGTLFRNLTSPYSVISREVRKAKSVDETIDAIYLSTLTRHATAEEKEMLRPIATASSEGKGDILWSVLNTRQFLFIQ